MRDPQSSPLEKYEVMVIHDLADLGGTRMTPMTLETSKYIFTYLWVIYDVNLEANVGQRSRHGAYDIGEFAEAPKVIPVNHGGLCDWPAIRDIRGAEMRP